MRFFIFELVHCTQNANFSPFLIGCMEKEKEITYGLQPNNIGLVERYHLTRPLLIQLCGIVHDDIERCLVSITMTDVILQ